MNIKISFYWIFFKDFFSLKHSKKCCLPFLEMRSGIYFSVDLLNVSTNINSNLFSPTCKFLLKEIENEIEVDFLTHLEQWCTILYLLRDFHLKKYTELWIYACLRICFSLKITAIFHFLLFFIWNVNVFLNEINTFNNKMQYVNNVELRLINVLNISVILYIYIFNLRFLNFF